MPNRTVCAFDGCGQPAHSKNVPWCGGHRDQIRRGKPLTPIVRGLTQEQRFWAKVKRAEGGHEDRCWLWIAAVDKRGYGRFNRRDIKKVVFAHRYAWELMKGEPPPPGDLDHLCRVPACVNPAHLEPVSHSENVRRGLAGPLASERYARPRLCPQGHPMEGDNLYVHVNRQGYINRQCRICRADSNRRRHMKNQSGHTQIDTICLVVIAVVAVLFALGYVPV